jgi:hypothetical protein
LKEWAEKNLSVGGYSAADGFDIRIRQLQACMSRDRNIKRFLADRKKLESTLLAAGASWMNVKGMEHLAQSEPEDFAFLLDIMMQRLHLQGTLHLFLSEMLQAGANPKLKDEFDCHLRALGLQWDRKAKQITATSESSLLGQEKAVSVPLTRSSEEVNYEYDVFICHASEDKDEIARPLAEALKKRDLRVWYDESTLRIGDSLRRAIDHGLANSRYGVVILSPSFFKKNWPQKELDGLAAREDGMEKVILPVWHRVSRDDVVKVSPTLADRVAAKTEDGLETVAEKIKEAMEPQISLETERRRLRFHLELLEEEVDGFVESYRSFFHREPTDEVVTEARRLLAIDTQINNMDLQTITEYILQVKEVTGDIIELSMELSRWMEDEAINMSRPD